MYEQSQRGWWVHPETQASFLHQCARWQAEVKQEEKYGGGGGMEQVVQEELGEGWGFLPLI